MTRLEAQMIMNQLEIRRMAMETVNTVPDVRIFEPSTLIYGLEKIADALQLTRKYSPWKHDGGGIRVEVRYHGHEYWEVIENADV